MFNVTIFSLGNMLCYIKGVIGCQFSTSWYDSLGSSCTVCHILWLNFLNGCVNQHPFYLLKNNSVHSDLFRCMSL